MITRPVTNLIASAAPVDDATADVVLASFAANARSPKPQKSQSRTVAAHAATPSQSDILRSCGNADSHSSEAGLGPRMAAFESAPPPIPSLRLLSDSRLASKDVPPKSDALGVGGATGAQNMSKKRSNHKKSTGTRLEVSAQTDISGACDIFQMFREIEMEKLRKRLSKAKAERNFERRNRQLLQAELDLAVVREEEATASCTSLSAEAHGLMHELWDMLAVAEAERQSANTRLETSSIEMRSKFENVVAQRQALENYCRLHRAHLDETLDAHGELGRLHYDLESRMSEHHRNFENQAAVLQEREEANAFERMREQELHRRYENRVVQEHELHRSFESRLADLRSAEEHSTNMLKQECSEVHNNHMTNILHLEEESRRRWDDESNKYMELLNVSRARLEEESQDLALHKMNRVRLEEESQHLEVHRANTTHLHEENHTRLEEEVIHCLELQRHNDELKEELMSNRDAERRLRKRLSDAEAKRLEHWQETHDANETIHEVIKKHQDLHEEHKQMLLEEAENRRNLELDFQQSENYALQDLLRENAELRRECDEQREQLAEATTGQYVGLLQELDTLQKRLSNESRHSSELRNKVTILEEDLRTRDDAQLELAEECMDLQQRLADSEYQIQLMNGHRHEVETRSRKKEDAKAGFSQMPLSASPKESSMAHAKRESFSSYALALTRGAPDDPEIARWAAEHSSDLKKQEKQIVSEVAKIPSDAYQVPPNYSNGYRASLGRVDEQLDPYVSEASPRSARSPRFSSSSKQSIPRFSSSPRQDLPRSSSPHQGHVYVDLHDDEPDRSFHEERFGPSFMEIPRGGTKESVISTPQSDHGSYWDKEYREIATGATTATRLSMRHAIGHGGSDTKPLGGGRMARRYITKGTDDDNDSEKSF